MLTQDSRRWSDIPFDELKPGVARRCEYSLDPAMVAGYEELLDGARRPPPAVGADVPSSVYSSFLPMFRALGGRMEQGTIHTHQSIALYAPAARVGDVLDAEVTVVSVESDGRRRCVEVQTEFSHQGRAVCTTRSRFLWGFSAPGGGTR
jgi:hypothetical protein